MASAPNCLNEYVCPGPVFANRSLPYEKKLPFSHLIPVPQVDALIRKQDRVRPHQLPESGDDRAVVMKRHAVRGDHLQKPGLVLSFHLNCENVSQDRLGTEDFPRQARDRQTEGDSVTSSPTKTPMHEPFARKGLIAVAIATADNALLM